MFWKQLTRESQLANESRLGFIGRTSSISQQALVDNCRCLKTDTETFSNRAAVPTHNLQGPFAKLYFTTGKQSIGPGYPQWCSRADTSWCRANGAQSPAETEERGAGDGGPSCTVMLTYNGLNW
ncbi:unnamed protein product [Pleuronectes platessa]|uniref:Uncharacterized protein n=1 Tax=Pleuronectes platessa TaxID=8262 RepID=A0A9N7YI69_PLEPL|nr:unnamed protein product [Pleuronectes platessa]